MKIERLVLGSLLAVSLTATTPAQELGPEAFVRADVEAREATLDGMATRVAALQAGASLDAQFDDAEQSRADVESVFERYGTTGAGHAAYGTRHAAEVAAWLASSPDWLTRYDELRQRFDALSQQLDALRGGN